MANENKNYTSPYKANMNNLLDFYDLEFQIVMSELINTLNPSIISSEVCQIVLQLMMQNAEYTKKFGKSEKANANAKQLIRLFDLTSQFNNFTGNMNTLQLKNNQFYAELLRERSKNKELQNKLDAIKNAEEW